MVAVRAVPGVDAPSYGYLFVASVVIAGLAGVVPALAKDGSSIWRLAAVLVAATAAAIVALGCVWNLYSGLGVLALPILAVAVALVYDFVCAGILRSGPGRSGTFWRIPRDVHRRYFDFYHCRGFVAGLLRRQPRSSGIFPMRSTPILGRRNGWSTRSRCSYPRRSGR